MQGRWVHPSQLYEAVAMLIVGVFLYARWSAQARDGRTTWQFGCAYAAVRVISEFFREGDAGSRLFNETVSWSQLATVGCLAFAWVWLRAPKRQSG